MSLHIYQHYGSTTAAFSYTVRVLLRFNSLYCIYVSPDAYGVMVRLVVRPVGRAGPDIVT
jgi:hypothetical protein